MGTAIACAQHLVAKNGQLAVGVEGRLRVELQQRAEHLLQIRVAGFRVDGDDGGGERAVQVEDELAHVHRRLRHDEAERAVDGEEYELQNNIERSERGKERVKYSAKSNGSESNRRRTVNKCCCEVFVHLSFVVRICQERCLFSTIRLKQVNLQQACTHVFENKNLKRRLELLIELLLRLSVHRAVHAH